MILINESILHEDCKKYGKGKKYCKKNPLTIKNSGEITTDNGKLNIDSTGNVHVKHIVDSSNLPRQIELISGTVSNLTVNDANGDEKQFSVWLKSTICINYIRDINILTRSKTILILRLVTKD